MGQQWCPLWALCLRAKSAVEDVSAVADVRFDFRLADKDSTRFTNELGNADELLQPGKRSRLRAC